MPHDIWHRRPLSTTATIAILDSFLFYAAVVIMNVWFTCLILIVMWILLAIVAIRSEWNVNRSWAIKIILCFIAAGLVLVLGVPQVRQQWNQSAKAAIHYPLSDSEQMQVKAAFGELIQAIGKPHRYRTIFLWQWPLLVGCQVVVSATPGKEAWRDQFIDIASGIGCRAAAPTRAYATPISDHFAVIFVNGSNISPNRRKVGIEADQLIAALRKPPLNLDVQRSDKMPPEGVIYIEFGANSSGSSR